MSQESREGTATTLGDLVPGLYTRVLPRAAALPVFAERRATCEHCAMCAPAEARPGAQYFSPDLKCCTFHPSLPAYAVGALLRSRDSAHAEGRRRVLAKIEARIGVTPFGIVAPAKRALLQREGGPGFGRSKALLCPYFDGHARNCSIWSYREAVCTTWFCKHDRGQDGLAFWQELRGYLSLAERLLTQYALRELGFDADAIATLQRVPVRLGAADLDDRPPDEAAYAALWGDWQGRERELYEAAYEKVTQLDAEGFERIGGLPQQLALERLRARHSAMLEPLLPDPLVRNPALRVEPGADGGYVVTAYRATDPIRLRKIVWDALAYFDGQTANATVLHTMAAQAGLRLSQGLLLGLYQHRILMAPAGGVPRARSSHSGG